MNTISLINLLENTLRDGSYVVDFQFNQKQTTDVVDGLQKLGFNMIEVGHGLGLGAWNNPKCGLSAENDETYITAAKNVSGNAKIAAFFIPGIGTENDIRAAAACGLDFIRIGININDFRKAKPFVNLAKKLGMMVAVNLMKSYAVKSYEFSRIVQEIDGWELADVIYLVDSAGCMMTSEVDEYIDRTKQKTKTEIGFHGHNNLSMAIANSVQAILSGATFVDTCVRGMGRSAGNAQTEIMIWMMTKMGIDMNVNLYDLYRFADETLVPMMSRLQGLTSDEIHIGISKFHTSYMPMVKKAVTQFDVPSKKLIKAVSDVNCLNPDENLFMDIAKSLTKKRV